MFSLLLKDLFSDFYLSHITLGIYKIQPYIFIDISKVVFYLCGCYKCVNHKLVKTPIILFWSCMGFRAPEIICEKNKKIYKRTCQKPYNGC